MEQRVIRAPVALPSNRVTAAPTFLPARKIAESISWAGVEVTSIQVTFGSASAPQFQHALRREELDWSDEDEEIPNEREGFGKISQVDNISALSPIQTLQDQYSHNPNLVRQFAELSRSFKAWRPVRGDGNCYYRAVLFAWLERSIALGSVDSLRSFDSKLWPFRRSPLLSPYVRLCHRLCRAWIARRSQCASENDVRALLLEVSNEFNKEQNDYAFIYCLRHLIAVYLREHAKEPVGAGSADRSNVLTYETWAMAISGARDIDDYCQQHIYVMNKDAADHVQWVCPLVLQTVVRICMVDRETADCHHITYGQGAAPPAVSSGGISTAGASLKSAAQLVSSEQAGCQPEIFLLFKPGHYDILVARDAAGELLDPDGMALLSAAKGSQVSPSLGAAPDAAALKRRADTRWRGLVRLSSELCAGFQAVLRCLEDKIVEELHKKRQRVGSSDESLFEGQLASVLEPLFEALLRQAGVPEDSPFSAEKAVPKSQFAIQKLLPSLDFFLKHGHPLDRKTPQVVNQAQAEWQKHKVPGMPHRPDAPAPGARLQAASWQVQQLPQHAKQAQESRSPQLRLQQQQQLQFAQPVNDSHRGHECCICMEPGATIMAPCACAYHSTCLRDYAQGEERPIQELACHLHDQKFGPAFVTQHLGDFAAAQAAEAAAELKATLPPTALLRRSRPEQVHIVESTPFDDTSTPSSPSMRRIPPSGRRVPQSGNLGAALGVPCVICFGEDGVLKTLHCGYKAHVACLRSFWSQKVSTLCRITDIRCPAEVAGCSSMLLESDLRDIVSPQDLAEAERSIQDVDAQNRQLIDELKRQNEEYRPMFRCAICLVDHEVEGCCTLPCQHRFCFESLQYHFDIIVRERRLSKLTCPAEGCGHNLRSEDSIHIFQQCLSEETYHKLLEFLTRDDPRIVECRMLGCEERVFCDDGDDYSDLTCPSGHRFCAKCENGPHPGISCEQRLEQIELQQREAEVQRGQEEAWRNAIALGWKPCPRGCSFGGGYKAEEECDHVTCECGFEFCWDCGVERQVPLIHDNRWHKPSCRYHTPIHEVAELPRFMPNCPECKKNAEAGRCVPCSFPQDDGYPESYVRRRRRRG